MKGRDDPPIHDSHQTTSRYIPRLGPQQRQIWANQKSCRCLVCPPGLGLEHLPHGVSLGWVSLEKGQQQEQLQGQPPSTYEVSSRRWKWSLHSSAGYSVDGEKAKVDAGEAQVGYKENLFPCEDSEAEELVI